MGILDLFQSSGNLMPEAISHPNISFLIPPSGSATMSTHNKGNLTAGFAKVFSNGTVTVESRFIHPFFISDRSTGTTATGQSLSVPVAVSDQPVRNTGIAVIANSAGTLNLSLRDSNGNIIAGGSRTIDVTAGQQGSPSLTQLINVPGNYTRPVTITRTARPISALA